MEKAFEREPLNFVAFTLATARKAFRDYFALMFTVVRWFYDLLRMPLLVGQMARDISSMRIWQNSLQSQLEARFSTTFDEMGEQRKEVSATASRLRKLEATVDVLKEQQAKSLASTKLEEQQIKDPTPFAADEFEVVFGEEFEEVVFAPQPQQEPSQEIPCSSVPILLHNQLFGVLAIRREKSEKKPWELPDSHLKSLICRSLSSLNQFHIVVGVPEQRLLLETLEKALSRGALAGPLVLIPKGSGVVFPADQACKKGEGEP